MKKSLFIFRVDNAIDLITNSSSEIFVLKGEKTEEMIIELVNNQIGHLHKINSWSLETHRFNDSGTYDSWEEQNEIDNFLSNFTDDQADRMRKIINEETSYSISIDDNITYAHPEIKEKLIEIGFEYKGRN